MRVLKDWPGKSLIVADAVSIVAGFVVFRTLCMLWQAETFARWEWLRVVLGLCLLLPRNGFDILAQRCAVRHPRHLRAWTALTLLVRLPFAIVAVVFFLAIARAVQGESVWLHVLLAASLPIQALVPDLAARVQGRFGFVSWLHLCRNSVPALLCLAIPQSWLVPETMAGAILAGDTAVFLIWWLDAARRGGLPGGRWGPMLRRGRNAIARRSIDQTLGRWMRVTSWNLDAVILGSIAPGFWARLAPARSLMMTAVIPLANYLGAVSPLMARESRAEIGRRFRTSSMWAMGAGVVAVVLSAVFSPLVIRAFFGQATLVDRETLVMTASRIAPMLILLLASSFWTTLRRDARARSLAAVHLMHCAVSICAGIACALPAYGYMAYMAGEVALAVFCVSVIEGWRLTPGLRPGGVSWQGQRSVYAVIRGFRPSFAKNRIGSRRLRSAEIDG